jgi:hypothetical protein
VPCGGDAGICWFQEYDRVSNQINFLPVMGDVNHPNAVTIDDLPQ